MKRVWDLAAAVARGGDYLLNAGIAILLVAALLFGGFGLWDNWNIYHQASAGGDLMTYKPTDTSEDAPNPTLSDLQKINSDVTAWLTLEGTNIDYPVVQGESNTDYVNRAVDGEFSLSGSLFLDCRNTRDFSDPVSVIYGHHMVGNVMFGELPSFLESTYFESHPTGTLFTPEHTYHIQWMACMDTDAYDSNFYNPTIYQSRGSIDSLLEYLQSSATQYRDVGATAQDRLLVLTTCYSANTNGRVVLVGLLG